MWGAPLNDKNDKNDKNDRNDKNDMNDGRRQEEITLS